MREPRGRWTAGPEESAAQGGGGRGAAGEPVHVTGPLWRQDQRYPPQRPEPWGPPPGRAVPGGPPAARTAPQPLVPPPGRQPNSRGEYGGNGLHGDHGDHDGYGDASRGGPRHPSPAPKRRRPLRRIAIALLAALLITPLGTLAWADTELNRKVDLGTLPDRPPAGRGTNYLIVGSDSRDGLSDQDRRNLHTGTAGGRRTDSMILLHTGAAGTSMVSLPRDSWVTLPGFTSPKTGKSAAPAKNKLNAAFSKGGPRMLVSTIEQNTGLRIDHYAEIGFAGFVNLVDAVGGVRMCLDKAVRDKSSGENLKKGCQNLDGAAALAFVRQRHQEAQGDLGRTRNQQKFLSALAHKAAAPDTVLDPSAVFPALNAGLNTLVVDQGTGLQDLTSMFRAVQSVTGGHGKRLNVPVATIGFQTPQGSAALWNRAQARKLFTELKYDRPVTFTGKKQP